MAEEEKREDVEETQQINISGPVDINIKMAQDAVLAGIAANGKPVGVAVEDGALVMQSLLTGKDPNNAKRVLLTDVSRMLRMRPFEPHTSVTFDVVTTGFGTVYTVPAGVVAKVWFTITNITANEVAVSLSIGGATVLPFAATPRAPLPPDGPGISGGPYILAAAEIVQHRCGTVNGAHIRVEVEEYGLGDAP